MPIMEKDMADFTAELRGQGHGPATVVKYHREAAAFAAWLGEKALTAERAAEYRGIEEIGPRYGYRDAKRDRAAVRAQNVPSATVSRSFQ